MSYVALYRKYRPKSFNDVVGQNTVVEILKNSIKNNHISHAYLFTGPRGTGKTSIAKILARAVNCLQFDDDVCNNCSVCEYMRENDSDIIEIDAASNNGVDEIRTLRDNVKLMPAFCKYKIYIIDEVHMLSTGAFNALLKTLEEPPIHVIFILATTEPNKIPATIMSRCQRFDFESISPNDIYKKLEEICKSEEISLNKDVIDYISNNSDGGLRDAINLLDQIVSLGKGKDTTLEDAEKISGKISSDIVIQIFKNILEKNYLKLLEISNSFIQEGKNLKDVVNMLLNVLRDLSIVKDVKNYFNENYTNELNDLNFPSSKILKVSNVLNSLLNEMKYSNNESMIFQIYLLSLIEVVYPNDGDKDLSTVNDKKKSELIHYTEDNKDNNAIITDEQTEIKNNKVENKSFLSELKKVRVNNCLALANKNILNQFMEEFDKINDYSSNKKYNNIVEILNNGKVVVASSDHLIFQYKNSSELTVFENVYDDIEKFLNIVFEKKFKIVGLTMEEWNQTKEQYVTNKKNNIKYTIMDENVVKLDVDKSKEITQNFASNIFGDNAISMK